MSSSHRDKESSEEVKREKGEWSIGRGPKCHRHIGTRSLFFLNKEDLAGDPGPDEQKESGVVKSLGQKGHLSREANEQQLFELLGGTGGFERDSFVSDDYASKSGQVSDPERRRRGVEAELDALELFSKQQVSGPRVFTLF